MTPLANLLIRQIASTGPITLTDYMAACLMHPEHGYYTTRNPLGADGDFTTAPEISQMFGEILGLCLAQSWLDRGAPSAFTLAELGPGRGTLMADIMRATAGVAGFHDAAQIHLVETSPKLRAVQANTLTGHSPTWHSSVDTLPEAPLFVVANEFFDALPVRQFQRDPDGWRERLIGLSGDGNSLELGLAAPAQYASLDKRLEDTKPGDIVETCAPARASVGTLGLRIAEHGGVGLIIDYGDWRSLGDTLQAVANHTTADPFAAPGAADLTTQVDFEALALAAHPAQYTRLTPQGVFLERLGITPRAEALASQMTGETLKTHIAAHRRLTHPAEMGSLFKVLGLFAPDSPPPPGLEI